MIPALLKQPKWLLTTGGVLFLGAAFFWMGRGSHTTDAPLTAQVTRTNIENFIAASGKLEPKHYVEVGAQVSGQLKAIAVEEGSRVKTGELLAEIDATVFETKVQIAAANLEGKRAQLKQLQAELTLASLRATRNLNLHQQKAVSNDVLLESQTNEAILKARIQAMEAQIKADAAALAGDQATLGYSKILAPIDGTVVSVSVREGQTLNASQNAPILLKLANLNVLTLRAEISEADVTKIHPKQPVYFTIYGDGKRRWHSTVRQILPTPLIVNDVVLYQALMDVDNLDGRLMDGMTAQVFFVLQSAQDALVVPLGAVHFVQTEGAHKTPMVKVHRNNGWQDVPVELGVRNRTHVQVTSGLSEGDVVQVGLARLRPNSEGSFNGPSGGRRGF